jgi:hypothetical protein
MNGGRRSRYSQNQKQFFFSEHLQQNSVLEVLNLFAVFASCQVNTRLYDLQSSMFFKMSIQCQRAFCQS